MNEQFVKYRKKLTMEGVFRSVLIGALAGLSVMLVLAGIFWYNGNENLTWLPPVAFLGLTGILFVILYLLKYRPTDKSIARRLDSLGLEERVITMQEYKDDDSYIARRQREDAEQALKEIQASQLKMKLKKGFVIALAIVAVLAVGAWTLQILVQAGIIKPGKDMMTEIFPDPDKYYLQYEVMGDGFIDGELVQELTVDNPAQAVEAIAMEGWVFVGWDDGKEHPYRQDGNAIEQMKKMGVETMTLTAVFQEVSYGEGEGMGAPAEDEEGMKMPAKPGEEGEGQGKPSDQEGESRPSQTGGGKYEPNNQVIDGETWYGGEYDGARGDASDEVSTNGDINGDQSDATNDYFNNIQP